MTSSKFQCSSFTVSALREIYRTPVGLQGYYPRVVKLSDDEYLCSFIGGTALESPDSRPFLMRSLDAGATWSLQGPVDSRDEDHSPTHTKMGFISKGNDGELFCLGAQWAIDPKEPDLPLVHPKTCGMRPNRLILRRSQDAGHTWSSEVEISVGVDVPIEAPTGVLRLTNGELLISFSTWKRWDGSTPMGHRVMVIRSCDNGRTWSEPAVIFHDATDRIGYWEGRIAEFGDGRLMATCWAYDWTDQADIENATAFSKDGGRTWTRAASLPVCGQTGWPTPLSNDTILFAYNHRKEPVGIRGLIAMYDGQRWTQQYDDVIFSPQNRSTAAIASNDYGVTRFQFGAPSIVKTGDNRYTVVFWSVANGRGGIDQCIIEVGS